jgi:hypothetical protein
MLGHAGFAGYEVVHSHQVPFLRTTPHVMTRRGTAQYADPRRPWVSFLRLASTDDLRAEITSAHHETMGNPTFTCVIAIAGCNGGTYVAKELVCAYALDQLYRRAAR